MTTIITVLVVLSCATIIFHAISSITFMNWRSSYSVWAFQALLGVGAFWLLLEILSGTHPSTGSIMIVVGLGAKYLLDRRRNAIAEVRHGRF